MARKTFKTGFGAADPPASRQRPHGASRTLRRTNLRCGRRTGNVVRAEGFEPPRLASREPKSRASTSSATPAGRARRRVRHQAHRTADPEALRHGNAPSRKRPIGDARSGTRTIEVRPHAHACARMDRVAAYIMTARACSKKYGALPPAAPPAAPRAARRIRALRRPARKPLRGIGWAGDGRGCRPARKKQQWKAACPFFSHV